MFDTIIDKLGKIRKIDTLRWHNFQALMSKFRQSSTSYYD